MEFIKRVASIYCQTHPELAQMAFEYEKRSDKLLAIEYVKKILMKNEREGEISLIRKILKDRKVKVPIREEVKNSSSTLRSQGFKGNELIMNVTKDIFSMDKCYSHCGNKTLRHYSSCENCEAGTNYISKNMQKLFRRVLRIGGHSKMDSSKEKNVKNEFKDYLLFKGYISQNPNYRGNVKENFDMNTILSELLKDRYAIAIARRYGKSR